MSADNSILLVRFSNKKWRMKEVFAIENLYYSFRNLSSSKPNPARLYEMMSKAKSYKSKHLAYDDAEKIFEDGYVEYGIQPIKVDYTWEKLLALAHQEFVKEIEWLKSNVTPAEYDYETIRELEESKKEIEENLNKKKG